MFAFHLQYKAAILVQDLHKILFRLFPEIYHSYIRQKLTNSLCLQLRRVLQRETVLPNRSQHRHPQHFYSSEAINNINILCVLKFILNGTKYRGGFA